MESSEKIEQQNKLTFDCQLVATSCLEVLNPGPVVLSPLILYIILFLITTHDAVCTSNTIHQITFSEVNTINTAPVFTWKLTASSDVLSNYPVLDYTSSL